MEALVNVARREHSKAVVQLLQLQRQLDRDKHRAVEAVELSKAKLEHELECCKKKLNATLVERNLVMVMVIIIIACRDMPWLVHGRSEVYGSIAHLEFWDKWHKTTCQ